MAMVKITNGKTTVEVVDTSFERVWKDKGWKLAKEEKKSSSTSSSSSSDSGS